LPVADKYGMDWKHFITVFAVMVLVMAAPRFGSLAATGLLAPSRPPRWSGGLGDRLSVWCWVSHYGRIPAQQVSLGSRSRPETVFRLHGAESADRDLVTRGQRDRGQSHARCFL
jgi:hypothetical protein